MIYPNGLTNCLKCWMTNLNKFRKRHQIKQWFVFCIIQPVLSQAILELSSIEIVKVYFAICPWQRVGWVLTSSSKLQGLKMNWITPGSMYKLWTPLSGHLIHAMQWKPNWNYAANNRPKTRDTHKMYRLQIC